MSISRKRKEVDELLRREISRIILYEMKDPRAGFVTVTRVHVAGDYRSAKVYVMVRGNEAQIAQSLAVLTHTRGHIQGLIADRIKLRWTPVLEFIEDDEMRQALRVDRILERMSQDEDQEDQEQERGE
jgi:ribosome-binding factor A